MAEEIFERTILLHGQESAVRFSVFSRWFTSVLAFLVAYITLPGGVVDEMFPRIFSILLVVLALNAILYVRLRGMQNERLTESSIRYAAIASASLDLVYIFALMFTASLGVGSALRIFFVVPIVVSMLSLGARGSVAVSVSASLLLLASALFTLPDFNSLLFGLIDFDTFIRSPLAHSALIEAGLVSGLYLLLGQFSGAIADFFTAREGEAEDAFHKEEKLVKELGVANEQLRAVDEIKSQLISIAAHQLRTPLSGIKWMLTMLEHGDVGPLTEDQKKLVHEGVIANGKLVALVNDMLTLDRLESGRLAYEFADADIVALVNEVVESLKKRAEAKSMTIEVFSDFDKMILSIDKERMRDVITNLVDNAIKYSKTGSGVNVMLLKMKSEIHIAVHDSGIGIPIADQTRVFTRFFRASNAVKEETEGTGLGLSIARNIALRHGGDITFDSKPGEGTTFIVRLPLPS